MLSTIQKDQLAQFGNLELLAKQVVEGFITGMHKSPFHGFSVEFAEHRLYNPGESTRHIDWKLYGRSEKMFTKKYEEETNLRCQMVVDVSSSMYYSGKNALSKLEFSVLAAASLSELLKRQRDAVGLSLFHNRLFLHTPAKSSGAHHRFLLHEMEKQLHEYEAIDSKLTETISCLHDVAELCHKRSLIVIFTDLLDDPSRLDEFMQSIQHMKHNKHEVIVFHVMDHRTELLFDFEDRPMEFVDLETNDKIRLNPGDVKQQYRAEANKFYKGLKMRCNQYKIDFVEADVQGDFDTVLQTYLIKRAKMR